MTDTRLPTPGQDAGTWGGVLNAYLQVAHDNSGALLDNSVHTTTIVDGSVTNSKVSSSDPIDQGKIAGLTDVLSNKVETSDFQTLQTQVSAVPTISISASAPPNPSVNDLWIDIS